MSAMSPTHGRRGGIAAGAGTGQQQLAQNVGLDRHRVGDAMHLRDHRRGRHHGRVHALLDAAVGALRDAEQLDAVAEFAGRADVGLA